MTDAMQTVRSISLGLWFRVGSRDETSSEVGLSHFMEHMMFKGTPTLGPLEISMHFDRLGAEINAFTTKEYTCYYARFVDDKLEEALRVLADMVVNSTFEQEAINTEREVVIEEIARSEDTPDDYVFELFSSSNLPDHAIGRPVLGTRKRVSSYIQSDCLAYHAKHYHTGNLVIAAAGNINHDALVRLCETYFSTMRAAKPSAHTLQEPTYVRGLFAAKRDIEQAHLVYGVPWFGAGDPRRYCATVLTTILGGSMSSRLFQEVREKRGLAYSIYASQASYLGVGQWCVYAGTRPVNIAEVVSLISHELTRMATDPVPQEELDRTIELICGQLLLGLETTNAHMARLGRRAVLGLEQTTPEDQVLRYQSVTSQDICALAQDFLTEKPALAVVSPYSVEELQTSLEGVFA